MDSRERLKQWLASGEARLQPLSFPQRELWEASPVPVPNVANHICTFINVRGPITPKDVEGAIRQVVQRQEVLRSSFLPGKNQPLQMIRATGEANFQFRELSPSLRSEEAIEELMQQIYVQPFDLLQGPLHRVEMLQRGPDEVILVFAVHHAVADGWSLGIFVQDLVAAYLQVLRRRNEPLPAVPLSYGAWGAEERAAWPAERLARQAEYWKSHLSGRKALWTTPAVDGSRLLERWVTAIPTELARAVRGLARKTSTTLFSTLLAAFQITLSRWTGVDDIVVGSPVANRNKTTVRETMGYFSDNVPIRAQVDPDLSFAQAVRGVYENVADSFANAMPFAELVKALGDSPGPTHNPVYDVRFALQNHPIPEVNLPGLFAKLSMRSTGTARFDLGCEVTEMDDALELVWLFKAALFSRPEIGELDRLFQTVLAAVCQAEEGRKIAAVL